MIMTTPLSLSDMPIERVFYVLDALPRFASEVGVWLNTPDGIEPVDFVNVNVLPDGTLIASWEDAFKTLPLHNVVVQAGGDTQVVNLCPVERIIDCYDRPIDSTFGSFSFTDSVCNPVEGDEWRCHGGRFGAWHFTDDEIGQVVTGISEILVWENMLSVNGTAHLIYVEATNKEQVAFQKINNSVSPVSGRTLQETLRLIYEWSLVSEEPFNCTDKPAQAAKEFIRQLKFTDSELAVLNSLRPMQISQFLQGDQSARVRPSNIDPLSGAITRMVFMRMSSLSLSAQLQLHGLKYEEPSFTNHSVLKEDERRLHVATQKFRDRYQIGLDIPIVATEQVMRKAVENHPAYEIFIANQLRLLVNRREVLNRVSNGDLF